MDLLYLITVD